MDLISGLLEGNELLIAIIVVALTLYISKIINERLLKGNTFLVAMLIALFAAGVAGFYTDSSKGLAGVAGFSGLAFLGGSMMRDWCIVATAYGAKIEELKRGGLVGVLALFIGILGSFFIGVIMALIFGFRDPVSLTTIGAGACTFIVGPVTGEGLGASSEVIAISVTAGIAKSIAAMFLIPLMGRLLKWHTPTQAMAIGGLVGSTSGVAAGLTALDKKLVPYGAMIATFYSGLGCLLCPSIGYLVVSAVF